MAIISPRQYRKNLQFEIPHPLTTKQPLDTPLHDISILNILP